jgi:hypothetical protein
MDLRTQLITFLDHVSKKVTKEMGQEIASRTISATTIPGLEVCDRTGTLFDVVDWWLVSAEFAKAARKLGEPVVETPFGLVWGKRTETEHMLVFDPTVEAIFAIMRI